MILYSDHVTNYVRLLLEAYSIKVSLNIDVSAPKLRIYYVIKCLAILSRSLRLRIFFKVLYLKFGFFLNKVFFFFIILSKDTVGLTAITVDLIRQKAYKLVLLFAANDRRKRRKDYTCNFI